MPPTLKECPSLRPNRTFWPLSGLGRSPNTGGPSDTVGPPDCSIGLCEATEVLTGLHL